MPSDKDLVSMAWPTSRRRQLPINPFPDGYQANVVVDREEFTRVQAEIGWTMRDGQWEELVNGLVPGTMTFAEHIDTGELVAVACGTSEDRTISDLGWVAVVPEHRGRGLGKAVCGAVTEQLLEAGYEQLRLSTQHYRLAALHIYIALGYEPIIDPATSENWRQVYRELGLRIPKTLTENRGSAHAL